MARRKTAWRQPRGVRGRGRGDGSGRSGKDSEPLVAVSDQLPPDSASHDGDHSDDSLPAPVTSDVTSTTGGAVSEELAPSTPVVEASSPSSLESDTEDVEIPPEQQLNGSERKRKTSQKPAESFEGGLPEEPQPKRKRGRPRLHPQSSPRGPAVTPGDEWEVEKIINSRIEAGTLIHYYEVKWRGFSSKHNTWEPKVNLQNCKEAIEEFEQGQ